MLKRNCFKLAMVSVLSLGVFTVPVSADSGNEGVIDEKWGKPVYVYGSALTQDQVEQLSEDMGYSKEEVESIEVTGEDMVKFLGDGNPDSNMYSSAVIERKDKGTGINVEIDNPENITDITVEQYTNAMITAGVEDAEVVVGSPVKVTGESALTGIYKAYDSQGETLDQDRMEVAQEELDTVADINRDSEGEEGFDEEQLDDALVDIKQELAKLDEDKTSKEDVEEIVNKELEKRGLDEAISNENVNRLIEMAYNYSQTDAVDSEAVKEQLEDLSEDIGEKLTDLKDYAEEKGIFEKVGNFIKELFQAIGNFLKGIFN